MQQRSSFFRSSILGFAAFLATCVLSIDKPVFGQAKATVPDAQIEANVLKALAGSPQLENQSITSTTVFGTVTLGGTVQDEASRDLADKLVSNTSGVQKVVDQMVVGGSSVTSGEAPQATNDSGPQGATNPNLQSDGTLTAPQGQSVPQPAPQPSYSNSGAPPQQAGQYPPPYRQPYAPQYGPPQRPYVVQKGGDAVVVPSGSVLRVRMNQGMDSKRTAVGTAFDGVVLNDLFAGGSVAIPRGASVKGTVIESHPAGEFAGKGELKLQLTQVFLGGRVYPIVTDFWWHQGADKTGNTVGNTVGLGAMGALIGGVAGGGIGAAVGAGIGGVAGLGVSASSHKGEAGLPPEAIVSFHLTQPADITTVSQAELNRLGAGIPVSPQPQMQRRYGYPPPYPPPPPPPPAYYGPGYYPAPY
jgi:hypothetical protein